MTCGPWKPVYLETFTSRIDELYFTVDVPESLATATITATAEVVGPATDIIFTLLDSNGATVELAKVPVENGKATTTIVVETPKLWYPHGYGEQPLYKLTALLGGELDETSKVLGLRRALVQQKPLTDAEGTSFFFEINNIPIWAGGSNWIPADSFLNRVDDAKYRRWLELVRDGNQVMIRYVVFRILLNHSNNIAFGEEESTSKTSFTKSATRLVFLSGRTLHLAAETTPPTSPSFGIRSRRRRSRT